MAGNSVIDMSTMIEVLRVNKAPLSFFLDQFFKRQINFTTPEIYFDKVYTDDRHMAPFVVPNVQGRVGPMTGYSGVSFRPAYVKPKDIIDPNMVIERQPGEALGTGSLSIGQRYDVVRIEMIRKHNLKHKNRQEWMAAKALIDGEITIVGEDYPETLVDFRRDDQLTKILTGNARWSEVTADPLGDLKAMRIMSNDLCGSQIRKVVFGQQAWNFFAKRIDLRELMNVNYGGQSTQVNLMPDGYADTVERMGIIQGLNGTAAIEAYVHTGKLINPITGQAEFVLPQNKVVGISDMVGGIRCFGAIKDFDANFESAEIFLKNWREKDPSLEFLLSQSAPLMVPKQPDATYSITVADAV